MNRISKTLALILALVMIFALAACGSGDTTPADTSKPAESGDPIVYRLSLIIQIFLLGSVLLRDGLSLHGIQRKAAPWAKQVCCIKRGPFHLSSGA